MEIHDQKGTSRRVRHRKKAQQPKSAQAYEQWKSQYAQKFAAAPAISKQIKPPRVLTLDDRISKVLLGDTRPSAQDESDERTSAQIHKIIDHAALVRQQSKQAKAARKDVFKQKAREVTKEKKARKNQPFRFTALPPELREMIYKLLFSCGHGERGKKPTFLWALKGYNKLYPEARKVWCQTNDFKFSLLESIVNTRDGLEEGEMGLLRWGTLIVLKDIQACSKLSPAIFQAQNLEHLTLEVASKLGLGLGLAIHQIIPHLKKLKQITLQFGCGKSRLKRAEFLNQVRAGGVQSGEFKEAVETRRTLDKMLGVEGKFMKNENKPWMQIWEWNVEGKDEVLRPKQLKQLKQHIKFD